MPHLGYFLFSHIKMPHLGRMNYSFCIIFVAVKT